MLVRTAAPASPGRIIRSALSLLFSSAPFERATPSPDDFRRPRGVSDMSGDVPDPASWVAGAIKSELERLLVFLGDAVDPGSSATFCRTLLIRYVSRAPRRVQASSSNYVVSGAATRKSQ